MSLCCAFGRKPACHEDGGKPRLHKLLSDSSAKCPSTHEVWKQLPMETYSDMDMLLNVMLLQRKQQEIQGFRLKQIFLAFWSDLSAQANCGGPADGDEGIESVPVALVREDVLAHATWTVPVASYLVVADHHRHHSLHLE